LVEQGTTAGVFHAAERELVTRVLSLDERRVAELMTPRTKMAWLDATASPEENWRRVLASGHTSYPVCHGGPDRVLGIVAIKDLWAQTVAGEPLDFVRALKPAVFLPETARAIHVLETFRRSSGQTEIVLVIGEHGGLEGMITLFDLLEAIVGDIGAPEGAGEMDTGSLGDRSAAEDGAWIVDGLEPADSLKERFQIEEFPQEDDYHTVGGLVMTLFGHLPSEGDSVDWHELRFEVLSMDRNRVERVRVSPTAMDVGAQTPNGPPDSPESSIATPR
jgi:putative hemolysin